MFKILPKSLLFRFFLIIIIPIIVTQLIVIHLFYSRHWYNVTRHTANSIASEIKIISETIKNKGLYTSLNYIDSLGYTWFPEIDFKSEYKNNEEIKILKSKLKSKINSDFALVYSSKKQRICVTPVISGNKYNICFSSKRLINPTVYIFVSWVVFLNLFFIIISLVFAKNQIRSISELAKAAENFGNGIMNIPFRPSGALEVRIAGRNFIKMKQKILENIDKRSKTLAMISHDLRTPLTRIKLAVEIMDEGDSEIALIKKDVSDMQEMISSYLEYSKQDFVENATVTNMKEWIEEFLKNNDFSNLRISAYVNEDCFCYIKQDVFKRVIFNVLNNASRYAKNAFISIKNFEKEKKVIISIEDDGTGIPNNEEKKKVFSPFYRSDKSRNINSQGSVGLGLTIAKQIVISHYGNIEILDSNKGGAAVVITLPNCGSFENEKSSNQ